MIIDFLLILSMNSPTQCVELICRQPVEIVAYVPSVQDVKDEIVRQATAAGVNVRLALAYADCESDFKYDIVNPTSGAKGVYQFLESTWNNVDAVGGREDYIENIRQFIKFFPRYPGWWKECKQE